MHTESSLGWGGQEIRIFLEAQLLLNRGHRVRLLCQPTSELYRQSLQAGIPVEGFPLNRLNTLTAIWACRSIIHRFCVDVVNTHSSRDTWIGSIAGRISSRRPIILRTRHLSIPIRPGFQSHLLYNVLPHGIITTGRMIQNEIVQKLKINPKQVESIPTGVDIVRFNSERTVGKVREELNLPLGHFLIGMVSVLRSWKGHFDLLKAAGKVIEEIPNSFFIIVGEGPMRHQIQEEIQKLSFKDSIRLAGFREDIPNILASLDLLVHPSYANEGVPQVVLQAMSMGKPVVASNIGGINEVVQNEETGLLIPPRNPMQLAAGIVRLLQHKDMRKRMGQNGRNRVNKNWTLKQMGDQTLAFYERCRHDLNKAKEDA